MTNSVANVVAGKPLTSGGILGAPLGTSLPTDANTTLAGGFEAFGYISADGVTEAEERSTEKIAAWGGDTVKVVQTEFSLTYAFTMIETLNKAALEAVYGDENVEEVGSLTKIKVNSKELPAKAYVFEIKDGDVRIRVVVPNGKITEKGEVKYVDNETISYPVTVEALPDGSGNNAYKYLDSGEDS